MRDPVANPYKITGTVLYICME